MLSTEAKIVVNHKEDEDLKLKAKSLLRVGFEATPFRTRTLIWRLRPTRPSQPSVEVSHKNLIQF